MRLVQTIVLLILAICIFTGCFYGGPRVGNEPVDFGELGMIETQTGSGSLFHPPAHQSARPAARPPTSIAMARVQTGSGWPSYTRRTGDYVEESDAQPTDEQLRMIDDLPLVDDAFIVSPRASYSGEPLTDSLRRAANQAGADLLMIYTFETRTDGSEGLPPFDLLTLGMLPDKVVTAETRCHAVLIDSQSGYIYAHARSDDESWQLANHWTDDDAARSALRRAEQRAFDSMLNEFSAMWNGLSAAYRW